jgi:hypothetical protein
MLMIVITTNQLLGRKFIAKIIRLKGASFGVHIEAIRMFWPREKHADLIWWIFHVFNEPHPHRLRHSNLLLSAFSSLKRK